MPFSCGLQLRIVDGPGRGLTFPIDAQEISIGRARRPDDRQQGWFRLNDDAVSRLHADLKWDANQERLRIFHRSETNMTYVNGQPIDEMILEQGDLIKVGAVTLEVQRAEKRFSGIPDQGAIPAGQNPELLGAPSRQTFAVRPPRQATAPAPVPAGKKLSIETPTGFRLTHVGGETFVLEGFRIGLNPEQKPRERLYDQTHTVPGLDTEMALEWDERVKTFSFARTAGPEVGVTRKADGLTWQTPMEVGQRVNLRDGDRLQVGSVELVFLTHQSEARPVQSISLEG